MGVVLRGTVVGEGFVVLRGHVDLRLVDVREGVVSGGKVFVSVGLCWTHEEVVDSLCDFHDLGGAHGIVVDSTGDFHSLAVPCLLDLNNSLGNEEDALLEKLSDFEGGEESQTLGAAHVVCSELHSGQSNTLLQSLFTEVGVDIVSTISC